MARKTCPRIAPSALTDIADEYLDLVRKLWDSWAPDAVLQDRERNIFADPSR